MARMVEGQGRVLPGGARAPRGLVILAFAGLMCVLCMWVGGAAAQGISGDLIVSISVPAASSTPAAESTITVEAVTNNISVNPAAPFTTKIYLSASSTFDPGAIPEGNSQFILVGSSEFIEGLPGRTERLDHVPVTLPPGHVGLRYLFAVADADNTVMEGNESNNVSTQTAAITIGGDLTVSIDVPGSVTELPAGATVTVRDFTRSINAAPVGASTTSFFLIRGTTLDGTEKWLGSRSVGPLDPSGTSIGDTPLTLPEGVAGTFRIIAKADAPRDAPGAVLEINEDNNISAPSSPFILGAELVAELDVPGVATFPEAGTTITVDAIARNNGLTPAPASTIWLYYSAVSAFDLSTATMVGSRTVDPLGAKGSPTATNSGPITFTLPPTDVGVRYLYLKANATGVVPESNEGNNVSAPKTITIGGDLRIVGIDVPGNGLLAGNTIVVRDLTRSDNAAPVGASTTSFYLIRGTTLDGTEIWLGSRDVDRLGGSITNEGTTSLTLPAEAGTFRIIAKANAGILPTPEINTSNNLSAPSAAFTLGPDLVAELDVPGTARFPGVGAPITVTAIMRNNGLTEAPASTVGLYYSAAATFDGTAVRMGSRAVRALGPKEQDRPEEPRSISFTLPPTDVGVRYLYLKADADGAVPESDENNVSAPQTITIGGDLIVSIHLTGGAIDQAPGAPVEITVSTRSINAAPVGASTTRIYLITGTTVDGSAVLLASHDVGDLPGAGEDSWTTMVTMPADALGRYRIIAQADADGAAIELREDNNLSAPTAAFAIGPDLTVLGISVSPAMALPGKPINVGDTTKNLGAGPAPPSSTGYYLSRDAVLGPEDVLLGRRALNGLNGREKSEDGTTVDIPGTTAPGCYFIIANADDEDVVREVEETNNHSTHNAPAKPIQVRPSSGVTLACAQNDFDGDRKADILWREDSGLIGIWLMDGATLRTAAAVTTVDETWTSQGTGDFNGDGKVDVLWRHDSGLVGVWLMNGTTLTSAAAVETATLDWTIEGVGDFNADGKADVLWRHGTGLVGIWIMNGTVLASAAAVDTSPAGWTIQGVADFNGDGKADILWRDPDGLVSLWLMNGTTVATAQAADSRPPEWTIQGVGDFNGDGKADVLWRDTTTGAVETWLMDGAAIASAPPVSPATLDWTIQGVGDFNGDGKADVLWRNDTGMVAAWFMNGASIGSIGVSETADLSWTIE